jgi:phosphatidylglycerol lysyltransferase
MPLPNITHGQPNDLEVARRLILDFGWNAMRYQLVNPGMRLWFSDSAPGVIGYVEAGAYRIVAGAPVTAETEMPAVVKSFAQASAHAGKRVAFFGAQDRLETVLATEGPVSRMLLGAQPVWHPGNWLANERGKKSLRAQIARARNHHVHVENVEAADAAVHRCLREWLAARGLPALHFLVEPQTLDRMYDRRLYVARQGSDTCGFLLASPIPLRNGWLIEQIVRRPRAPNGTAELLLDRAMHDFHALGNDCVTLGLSPLSTRVTQPDQPFWLRCLLSWMRAHGSRFYNFRGLENFKAKFLPDAWEPIHVLALDRKIRPALLWAIICAFAGTSPVWFLSKALGRAAVQELSRLRRA